MITINTINNSWYFISSFVIEPNHSAIYDETTLTKLQARDLLLAFDAKRIFLSYVDLELVRAVKNGGNQVPTDSGLSKQDILVSGNNIKTINGMSILGSGNIVIQNQANSSTTSGVTTINSRDGAVILTASDVNLGNVNNTSDINKPISSATQTSLNTKYSKTEVDTLVSNYIPISQKGSALGVATLGADNKVPLSQLSAVVLNETYIVSSEIEHLALIVEKGSLVIRTDLSKSYVKADTSVGLLSGYRELISPIGLITKASVGLGNVVNLDTSVTSNITDTTNKRFVTDAQLGVINNTSNTNTGDETTVTIKSKLGVATSLVDGYLLATDYSAFINKEPSVVSGTTSQYYRGDKSWQTLDKSAIGLGNVNNTSDINKPISTLVQSSLDTKQPLNTNLSDIASITAVNNNIIQYKSGAFVSRTLAQFKTDLTLATVASTGSYNDLIDTPVNSGGIPTGTILQGLWRIPSFGNISVPSGYWPLDGTVVNSPGSPLHGLTVPDTRGYVLAAAKSTGADAGTSAGTETITLSRNNLPNVSITPTGTFTPAGTVTINSTTLDDTYPAASPFNFDGTGSSSNIGRTGNQLDKQRTHTHTASFTGTSGGVSTTFNLNNNVTQAAIDSRQLTFYVTQILKL